MKRRATVVGLLGAAAWPAGLHAQGKLPPRRIGFLAAGTRPRPGGFSTADSVLAGLRERGHAQLQWEALYAEGQSERLSALAQQLLQWQPDLIVTSLTPAAVAAQRATRSIPIVMAGAGEPAATGLVQSLARPGGNITGVAAQGPQLAAKSVELMAEVLPGLRRMGLLLHATDPFTPALVQALEPAGVQLGLRLQIERVTGPAEYGAAFAAWTGQRVQAVFVQPTLPPRPAIELALQHRLPSCSFVRSFAEQGGLLAYAPDLRETARLAADIADRILRGASPAQLPVQQNTRFDLSLNRRTAAALKLELPAGVLTRATEVIE
jgi:putative tryptophan/tyrosine transport system substrate-binding protein